MKLVLISDTHEQADKITVPDGDVLIHAGDWTYRGVSDRMQEFWEWFASQPHKYKVAIAGNHELGLDSSETVRQYNLDMIRSYCGPNTHYLENSGCQIDGIEFWGSPVSPRFYDWAFNRDRGQDIIQDWNRIPLTTQVLITHGPPQGILDQVPGDTSRIIGCEDLKRTVQNLTNLKLHVFGHIHSGYGTVVEGGVRYVNASVCNHGYQPINPPIVVEI